MKSTAAAGASSASPGATDSSNRRLKVENEIYLSPLTTATTARFDNRARCTQCYCSTAAENEMTDAAKVKVK